MSRPDRLKADSSSWVSVADDQSPAEKMAAALIGVCVSNGSQEKSNGSKRPWFMKKHFRIQRTHTPIDCAAVIVAENTANALIYASGAWIRKQPVKDRRSCPFRVDGPRARDAGLPAAVGCLGDSLDTANPCRQPVSPKTRLHVQQSLQAFSDLFCRGRFGKIVVGFHAHAVIVGVSGGRDVGCHGGKHHNGNIGVFFISL